MSRTPVSGRQLPIAPDGKLPKVVILSHAKDGTSAQVPE
jgi:hypothetical protein